MAAYSISASGTHALTASTTGLQLDITTPSSIGGSGRSNPVAKYDQGLIRFSDGTSYWGPVPILGGPQFVPVPANATSFGYALLGGAVVSVTEIIGGIVFFSSPTGSLAGLSDVTLASLSNGQVLQWNASAGKWENATVSGGGGHTTLLASFDQVTDLNGVSVPAGAWLSVGGSLSFTPTGAGFMHSIIVSGTLGMLNTPGGGIRFASALLLDSTRYLLGGFETQQPNTAQNALAGVGPVPVTGLSASAHTAQVQVYCDLNAGTLYCRPTALPSLEFLNIRVLEST